MKTILMSPTQDPGPTIPASIRVANIKIRNHGQIKKVSVGDALLRVGDYVILEVDSELTYGVVHTEPQTMPFFPPMRVMKTILRKATVDDCRMIDRCERMAEEAQVYCQGRIKTLGLAMKLVEVYRSLVGQEMWFVYTSPEWVDFRQLVRELGRRFGARIEMHQIGKREEAKHLSGVDTCGLVLCCAAFMTEFKPVKVKQAKAQGLPMEESRLIGVCGLLKCCLMFELEAPILINPTRAV